MTILSILFVIVAVIFLGLGVYFSVKQALEEERLQEKIQKQHEEMRQQLIEQTKQLELINKIIGDKKCTK